MTDTPISLTLTKNDAVTLLTTIEKAYRRGFQNGFEAARNPANDQVSLKAIYKYRFETPLDSSMPPPTDLHSPELTVLEKQEAESRTAAEKKIFDEINYLFTHN